MTDELGGKLMTEFAALRPKTSSFLIDDGDENKKAAAKKGEDYKHCLEATQLEIVFKKIKKVS